MFYMIDKNMKICKSLKLLENADDHDNNNDEKKKKKKKNENYDFIDYISDDDFNAASVSAADSSHAISDQSSSYFVIDHFNFFHDISDQSCNACSVSSQSSFNFSVISHSSQNKCKC